MKTQYEKINQSELPEKIKTELQGIRDATKDFSDKEIMEIEQENFDSIYSLIEKDHPEALGIKKEKIKKPKKKEKAVKNKAKVQLSDFEKELAECKELVKKSKKPRKEPTKHTRESRLVTHLKGIFNLALEVHPDNEDKLLGAEKRISAFYKDFRENYLGLERKDLPEKFKKKIEKKIEKAEAA